MPGIPIPAYLHPKGCETIAETRYIAAGWSCCACPTMEGDSFVRQYNGEQRSHCKRCGHPRCDKDAPS